MKPFLLVLCLFIPQVLEASVLITEVAWMGTLSSANHEWIELYNTGSQVDLTGWTLTDGSSLSIALYGTLDASQYAVLERTSDESAPGAAYIVYSGALVNTGTTLTLKDANGSVIDSVVGGEGWQNIGGNNTSKETPQRSSSGWTTLPATPGSGSYFGTAAPPAQQPVQEEESNATTTASITTSSGGGGGGPVKSVPSQSQVLNLEPRELSVAISALSSGYVNQPVSFKVTGFGLAPTILHSLEHTWNFGDLEIAHGSVVTHSFSNPGRYIVMVESAFTSHTAVARHEIEIRAIPLEMEVENTSVILRNTAQYEVDISNFILLGTKTVLLPDNSWLLPGAKISIPKSKLGGKGTQQISLFDARGKLMIASEPIFDTRVNTPLPLSFTPLGISSAPVPRASVIKAKDSAYDFDSVLSPSIWPTLATRVASANATTTILPATTTTSTHTKPTTNTYVYIALVLVMLVAIAGVLTK